MPASDERCRKESLLDPAASCGAAIAAEGLCLAHLNDQQRFSFLESLEPRVDVSDVTFSFSLLGELLTALTDGTNRPHLGRTDFSGATFTEGAYFSDATFTGGGHFIGAIFTQDAYFSGATFTQDAYFRNATFTEGADFSDATFTQITDFHGATFTKNANFRNATFTQDAGFPGATFGNANFSGATFTEGAHFSNATFTRNASFSGARLLGRLEMRCHVGALSFAGAELAGELVAEVAAREVNAQRVRGSGSMTLRVRAGRVNLARLVISGPVTVQGLSIPLEGVDESDLADPVSGQVPAASVDSLREVDAERLVLTDLDLTRCLFAGMYRVEQLRLDGQCTFDTDPRRRRRTLAEEHHWRADHATSRIGAWVSHYVGRRAGGWTSAPKDIEAVGAARLQVLYRQLRVSTESSKNEPGAADFYYGEMEMRRHSKAASRPERIIVTLYWLISGYGLRASRAITTLAAAIAAATIIFATIGFAHASTTIYRPLRTRTIGIPPTYQQSSIPGSKPGWGTAFYHAIDSSTSLLHTPGNEALTPAGRATEIALRLLGPVLLGLAVLAVRGRVKR